MSNFSDCYINPVSGRPVKPTSKLGRRLARQGIQLTQCPINPATGRLLKPRIQSNAPRRLVQQAGQPPVPIRQPRPAPVQPAVVPVQPVVVEEEPDAETLARRARREERRRLRREQLEEIKRREEELNLREARFQREQAEASLREVPELKEEVILQELDLDRICREYKDKIDKQQSQDIANTNKLSIIASSQLQNNEQIKEVEEVRKVLRQDLASDLKANAERARFRRERRRQLCEDIKKTKPSIVIQDFLNLVIEDDKKEEQIKQNEDKEIKRYLENDEKFTNEIVNIKENELSSLGKYLQDELNTLEQREREQEEVMFEPDELAIINDLQNEIDAEKRITNILEEQDEAKIEKAVKEAKDEELADLEAMLQREITALQTEEEEKAEILETQGEIVEEESPIRDLLDPSDWNEFKSLPKDEQKEIINDVVKDIQKEEEDVKIRVSKDKLKLRRTLPSPIPSPEPPPLIPLPIEEEPPLIPLPIEEEEVAPLPLIIEEPEEEVAPLPLFLDSSDIAGFEDLAPQEQKEVVEEAMEEIVEEEGEVIEEKAEELGLTDQQIEDMSTEDLFLELFGEEPPMEPIRSKLPSKIRPQRVLGQLTSNLPPRFSRSAEERVEAASIWANAIKKQEKKRREEGSLQPKPKPKQRIKRSPGGKKRILRSTIRNIFYDDLAVRKKIRSKKAIVKLLKREGYWVGDKPQDEENLQLFINQTYTKTFGTPAFPRKPDLPMKYLEKRIRTDGLNLNPTYYYDIIKEENIFKTTPRKEVFNKIKDLMLRISPSYKKKYEQAQRKRKEGKKKQPVEELSSPDESEDELLFPPVPKEERIPKKRQSGSRKIAPKKGKGIDSLSIY